MQGAKKTCFLYFKHKYITKNAITDFEINSTYVHTSHETSQV